MADPDMTPDERDKRGANQVRQPGDADRSPDAPAPARADRRRGTGRRRKDVESAPTATAFDPTSRGDETGEVL